MTNFGGIKEILMSGGVTLACLILLSVYSIALIWERWRFYGRSLAGVETLLEKVRGLLKDGTLNDIAAACQKHKGLASSIIMATLVGPSGREERKHSAERAAAQAMTQLERGTSTLGTIASVAPYIGLFGTVLGVMRAFKDLAGAAGAGPGVVAIGISEALICTATGLFVAVPAVAAYNYFNHRATAFAEQMGWITEEILDGLTEKARK